jgi:HD-GYP domain-containing protein (c-di-GMP phosphodiesterase class II)
MINNLSRISIAHGDKLPSTIIDVLNQSDYQLTNLAEEVYLNLGSNIVKSKIDIFISDDSIKQYIPQLEKLDCTHISEHQLYPEADLFIPLGFPQQQTLKTIQFAIEQSQLKKQNTLIQSSLQIEQQRLEQLTQIGIALSQEKNLGRLLKKILNEAQLLSNCDAVSLFLIDSADEENPQLVFKLAQNTSIKMDFEEKRFPLNNKSIAGYCANNQKIVNIPNAYQIIDQPYSFDSSFDKSVNYRTISILVIPITNNQNKVIGVIQFINRKLNYHTILATDELAVRSVISFDKNIEVILAALAGQAAIAIENSLLVDNINNLLDGFVHASVTAIEQRDPTTSGHSFRVADLTCGFAESLQRTNLNDYNKVIYNQNELREIRFASLLHDFGKVGVRENVLVKPKKLDEGRLEVLQYRFELEKERVQRQSQVKIISLLHHQQYDPDKLQQIKDETDRQLNNLDELFASIISSNEPTILPDGSFEHLQAIKKIHFKTPDGDDQTIISENDFLALSVRKGSLTEEERKEIQSHVTHTFNFLSQIPWTTELSNVPTIARSHHEKLNGSGYPLGLTDTQIPFPSKMMAICDIFDALIAKDRPYKRALPLEIALKIINSEAKEGYLDQALVDIFMQAKIYDITQREGYKIDWEKDSLMKKRSICDVNLK